jgi:hypothetical protein
MNDKSRATNDQRRNRDLAKWLVAGGRWSMVVTLVSLALGILVACAATPEQAPIEAPAGGGSFSPETVAKSFFEDLRKALADPKLSDDEQRGAWVERLAGYFAPNERDDQRPTTNDQQPLSKIADSSFVLGRSSLVIHHQNIRICCGSISPRSRPPSGKICQTSTPRSISAGAISRWRWQPW